MAFLGACQAIANAWGVDVSRSLHFGGTSIGALVACLLAVGYSTAELEAILMREDLNALIWGSVADLADLRRRRGWNSGDALLARVRQLIRDKVPSEIEELTFRDLPSLSGRHLTVVISDNVRAEPVYVSSRDEAHWDLSIARCVVASMRFPGVFTPDDDAVPGVTEALDGGMLDNFPFAKVVSMEEGARPEECLGVRVLWEPTDLGEDFPERTLRTLMRPVATLNWSWIVEAGLASRVLTLESSSQTLAGDRRAAVVEAYRQSCVDLRRMQSGEVVSEAHARMAPPAAERDEELEDDRALLHLALGCVVKTLAREHSFPNKTESA